MKQHLEKISITENMSLITLYRIPYAMDLLGTIFTELSERGINVDMISQTAPLGGAISISFTLPEEDLPKALAITGSHREEIEGYRSEVSTGNSKLSFFGDSMRTTPGVAAYVFSTLADLGVDAKLITTSEVDISILVEKSSLEHLERKLAEAFGLEPVIS